MLSIGRIGLDKAAIITMQYAQCHFLCQPPPSPKIQNYFLTFPHCSKARSPSADDLREGRTRARAAAA